MIQEMINANIIIVPFISILVFIFIWMVYILISSRRESIQSDFITKSFTNYVDKIYSYDRISKGD